MKIYHGSCHCGAVRFEADVDLSAGTIRCNCTFCAKIRCWAVAVKPAAFRLVAGEADLHEYRFGAKRERHYFCRHCGVRPFGIGDSPTRGIFHTVSVACLENASLEELASAPITYVDGLNDNWTSAPVGMRYL